MEGKDRTDFFVTLEELTRTLQYMTDTGWKGFDCSEKTLEIINGWGNHKSFPSETLTDVRIDLGDCRRCRLSEKRTHIVFGAGNEAARLLFVGEGPGYEEDQQGVPFVGAAGQLLTRIIKAIQLTRDEVYICNVIKCRPPGNRNPLPDEMEACFPILKRQIQAVRPDCICALGTFAARVLLGTDQPISRLRGRFHDYRGIKVMPTYHPAYLLRNPEKKKDVWEDMKQLMKEIGTLSV